MIRFIERDLGFCGCAAAEEALEVLVVTLRFAKQYGDSFDNDDSQEKKDQWYKQWYQDFMQTLRFNENPGVTTWFLYMLEHHGLIQHGFNVTVCTTTPKGEQLRAALEHFGWEDPEDESAKSD